MVDAEAAVRQAHNDLTKMLEQTDGGDTLKRARNEWYEASAQTDYVRLHEGLAQYRPAVEAEEAEALSCWEQMQPWRAKIRTAKMMLAKLQGPRLPGSGRWRRSEVARCELRPTSAASAEADASAAPCRIPPLAGPTLRAARARI